MGIGVGLLLIAVGAILTWAVTADVQGIDIQVVGVILMIVGLVGILLDVIWWHSWRGPMGYRRATYVEGGPAPRGSGYWPRGRRATYVEEEEAPAPPPPGPPPP
jgi:hypothetical protein